jgi:flagellar basal-body rod protein FlgC
MFEGDIFRSSLAATSGMRAQAERLRLISENIANADTPGYRRKLATFEQVVDHGRTTNEVQLGRVTLSQDDRVRIYAPDHPMADETGYYDGSNVNLVIEIADAREAQRSYEANLRIYEQTRQMSQGLLDLLRR